MTPQELKQVKKEISLLYIAVTPLLEKVWTDNIYTVIFVLLQNIQFDTSDCINSDHSKDLNRFYDKIEALKSLAKYEDVHIFNYIIERIDQIMIAHDYYNDIQYTNEYQPV